MSTKLGTKGDSIQADMVKDLARMLKSHVDIFEAYSEAAKKDPRKLMMLTSGQPGKGIQEPSPSSQGSADVLEELCNCQVIADLIGTISSGGLAALLAAVGL